MTKTDVRDSVILVDEKDNEIGVMEKLLAHKNGVRHRAFSIFVLNKDGQLLLQKRASHKYHSPGLWSNTCCSHQLPGENEELAVLKRLDYEMGITCKNHSWIFDFTYNKKFDNGLIENEYDRIYLGYSDENPVINTLEVEEYMWIGLDELQNDLMNNIEHYTYWLIQIFPRFKAYVTKAIPVDDN